MALRTLLLARPDLIYDPKPDVGDRDGARRGWGRVAVGGLAVALGVAVFLAPIASQSPDGLEFVGKNLDFLGDGGPGPSRSPMPEYQLPGLRDPSVATAAAGVVGTLVVFAVGLGLARALARRAPTAGGMGADAA